MTDLTVKKSHNTLVSEDTKKGRLNPLVLLEGEDKMEVVPRDSWPNAVEGDMMLPWGEQEVREAVKRMMRAVKVGIPLLRRRMMALKRSSLGRHTANCHKRRRSTRQRKLPGRRGQRSIRHTCYSMEMWKQRQ